MERLEHLSALHRATRAIGLSDSLDELVDQVLERAQELIEFEHCAFMLYDPDREVLRVERVRGYGDRKDQILGLTLEKGEGLSGWAVAEETAARVGDVDADPRYVPGLDEARSNLAVPLIVQGQVAGVINVESERPDAFTEQHEMLLTVLGAQAALAIVASRARQRLERRVDELDALHRISRLASDARDLDETLRAMLEITRDIVPEGQVAILLLDQDEEVLRVRAAEGYGDEVDELAIPLGEGVTGKAAAAGRTIVVNDVRDDPAYIPGVPGGRSEVAVPLIAEGSVVGVLNAESTSPGAYGQDEINALTVIAQQAATVLHTVKLHEQTRRLAVTDPLTGLHNRRYFIEHLEDHVSRAERYDEQLALLLLDCDLLKQINDRHGHHWGDRSLKLVSRILRESLRESDEIARIGGDEFAALLLESSEAMALRVTERLSEAIQETELVTEAGRPVDLSVSIGLAFFPEDADSARGLLRSADAALYRAKRKGRSRLARFSEVGDEEVQPDGDVRRGEIR